MHSSHQEYSREVFHYSFKYEKTTDYLNHFQKLTKAQSSAVICILTHCVVFTVGL